MLTLWCLNPPVDDELSQSPPADLIGLAPFLFKPDAIEESYLFLLELSRSFSHAVKTINEKKSVLTLEFFQSVACVDDHSPSSEDLYAYCVKRLDGKTHGDAMLVSNADLDKLIEVYSLLENAA